MNYLPKFLLIVAGVIFAVGIIWAISQLFTLNRDSSKQSADRQENRELADDDARRPVDQTLEIPIEERSEAVAPRIESKSETIPQKRIIKKVITVTTEHVYYHAPVYSSSKRIIAEAAAGGAWAEAGIDDFGQAFASAYAGSGY